MRWRLFRSRTQSSGPGSDLRLAAAHEAFSALGATRAAATLLIEAGYTNADLLLAAPWTAQEAGGHHQSAEWRLTMQPSCTPAALEEVRAFRLQLIRQRSSSAQRRPGG